MSRRFNRKTYKRIVYKEDESDENSENEDSDTSDESDWMTSSLLAGVLQPSEQWNLSTVAVSTTNYYHRSTTIME